MAVKGEEKMKKKILPILMIALTLVLLVCAMTVSVSAAEETTTPSVSIDKFNLVFEDNVYLKYAVKFDGVEDEAITEDNIGMLYFGTPQENYVADNATYTSGVVGYTTIDSVKYYTFEYRHITAKQMTDYVYSVAYIDVDGERYYSAPVKYSVLDYCYAKLGKTGVASDNEDFKTMLESMLEYGANAQKYFNYNTQRLANDDYFLVEVIGGTLEDGFKKGIYNNGETAILTAPAADEGFEFAGWKNSAGEIVTTDNPATLTGFAANDTYTATYKSTSSSIADGYIRCDEDGNPDENGSYILFGEYPQTIKADDVTITETIDSRVYYLGSDGNYYAKVSATPCGSYTFSTGETVSSGSVYYFKVEPIRWRILTKDGGKALILCDSIIANMAYQSDYIFENGSGYTTANGAPDGTYMNNYKYSEVRQWLNETFYATAFNDIQRELIIKTLVDNSAESTGNASNPYVCGDTEDNIFLLSYEESTNSAYGMGSDSNRTMLTSDYSRATGAYMSTSNYDYGNGWWWLRSPYDYYITDARVIRHYGSVDLDYVWYSDRGVVPALWIRL